MAKAEKELESISENLTDKQKLFCELITFSKGCFGNATKSYMEAYSLRESQRYHARTAGSRLLTNANTKAYIAKILSSKFNNKSVDQELSKLMHQDTNLIAKLGSIQEFNKLQKRIKEKLEITVKPDPILKGVFGKEKVSS